MDFKEFYELPLQPDPEGYTSYAWTNNGEMALTFDHNVAEDLYKHIIALINGESTEKRSGFTLEGVDFYREGREGSVFSVRGWGALTGTGGLHLPYEQAEKIQDDFAAFILEKIT
jgi:hypothetical protein